MNIIVHHPQCTEDISALRRRVASIHAQAVIAYIQKLPCPKEQKLQLYGEMKRTYQEER